MTIKDILQKAISSHASDIHINVGSPPTLRIEGELSPVPGTEVVTAEVAKEMVLELLTPTQKEIFLASKEFDLSYAYKDTRFRVNVYHQRGFMGVALRLIPFEIPTIEELGLPPVLSDFCKLPQGFVLITGPTGEGKSTTIAAMLESINRERSVHIVTVEDPIEYVFEPKLSIIDQREVHQDTHSWEIALRSVLREDPDIVLIGEMRDFETVSAAVTIAETGHLVFATLHTNSAAQTVDRIIDVFPENQQRQIRIQLASIIEGIISQRLVPSLDGRRVPATEILLANSAIRNIIREGKTHQIDNVIATSYDLGMISLERSLATLVKENKISSEVAKGYTLRPEEVSRLVSKV